MRLKAFLTFELIRHAKQYLKNGLPNYAFSVTLIIINFIDECNNLFITRSSETQTTLALSLLSIPYDFVILRIDTTDVD